MGFKKRWGVLVGVGPKEVSFGSLRCGVWSYGGLSWGISVCIYEVIKMALNYYSHAIKLNDPAQ